MVFVSKAGAGIASLIFVRSCLLAIILIVPGVALARTTAPAPVRVGTETVLRSEKSKAQIQVIKVQTPRVARSTKLRARVAPPAAGDLAAALKTRPRQPKRVAPLRVPHTMERLRYQLELLELQGH